MLILGISAWYHDAAACLVRDGEILAAAEEERFSRLKHDARFPRAAIASVLATAGASPGDLDLVVYYEKPILKFSRLLETFLAVAPRGLPAWTHYVPGWLRDKLRIEDAVRRGPRLHSWPPTSRSSSSGSPTRAGSRGPRGPGCPSGPWWGASASWSCWWPCSAWS